MNTISLSFFFLVLISSIYYFVLGGLIVLTKQKYLDVFTIISLQIIKFLEGSDKYGQQRAKILENRDFRFYGIYYIVSSVVMFFIALLVI